MSNEKAQRLGSLQHAWSNCIGCKLHESRKHTVFGYGNPDARVVIVGEAPGSNEDEKGLPFIGNSGQLLDQYLASMSVDPEIMAMQPGNMDRGRLREILLNDFYFCNIVNCRPPENRDPTPKEIEACRPRLIETIYTIDPIYVVAVGGLAISALVGKKIAITSFRGELFDIDMPGRHVTYKLPVLAILHPSFLLRQNDFKQDGGWGEKTYNDLLQLHQNLDQLAFFHHRITPSLDRPRFKTKR